MSVRRRIHPSSKEKPRNRKILERIEQEDPELGRLKEQIRISLEQTESQLFQNDESLESVLVSILYTLLDEGTRKAIDEYQKYRYTYRNERMARVTIETILEENQTDFFLALLAYLLKKQMRPIPIVVVENLSLPPLVYKTLESMQHFYEIL